MRLALVLGLALLACSATAFADGQDPAAAEVLFRAGREASVRGDYPAACAKFKESYRLDPAEGTALNLADCEEHTGELASAWQRFHDVMEALPQTDDRRAIAQQRAAALEHRLPRLTLALARGAPAGTKVTRDDVELGDASLGLAIPVNPGVHTVVVTAPGRAERRVSLTLSEARAESVVLEPGDALVVAPPLSSREPSTRRAVGWGVAAAGVAALGAGAILGVEALSRKSTSDADCTAGRCATSAGVSAFDEAKTFSLAADVCFAVGLVAAGVGTYLVLTSGGSHEVRRSAVRVAPVVSRSGGGVGFAGDW